MLTLDSPIPETLLEEVRDAIDADLFRQIELVEA